MPGPLAKFASPLYVTRYDRSLYISVVVSELALAFVRLILFVVEMPVQLKVLNNVKVTLPVGVMPDVLVTIAVS